jgi:hypothetical protein
MENLCARLEIVCLTPTFQLFDGESYQRSYVRTENSPQEPGLYVVHWPAGLAVRRFDEHAVYHGPYRTPVEARAALHELENRLNGEFAQPCRDRLLPVPDVSRPGRRSEAASAAMDASTRGRETLVDSAAALSAE